MRLILGHILIFPWLVGNIFTTVFLAITFLVSVVRGTQCQPYFAVRSIASVDTDAD